MSTTGSLGPSNSSEEIKSVSERSSSPIVESPKDIPQQNLKEASDTLSTQLNNGPPISSQISSSWEVSSPADKDICRVGGGDGLAIDDVSSQGGTPPMYHWSLSLQNLLNDSEGYHCFKEYLKKEGPRNSTKLLSFWSACQGLRKMDDIKDLIIIIWDRYVGSNIIQLSKNTKKQIKDHIDHQNFSTSIFHQAQREVEFLMEVMHKNFLKSKYYMTLYFGKELVEFNIDLEDAKVNNSISVLPTLNEDCEFPQNFTRPSKYSPTRLTSTNLLASASYRSDGTCLEENAGIYLRNSNQFESNPFHAGYYSGHAVTQQNSELQSISSGTRTEKSGSYKSGSMDCKSHLRFGQHPHRSIYLNKESNLNANAIPSHQQPRTMEENEIRSGPSPSHNPKEFAKLLKDKLLNVQKNVELNDKFNNSMRKIVKEDNCVEARREHAKNSLPPNRLLEKLHEKKVITDGDPSDQSILDNHIRNWDPTSGSARNSPPIRRSHQLPHLLPQASFNKTASKGKYSGDVSSAPHSCAGTPMMDWKASNAHPAVLRPPNVRHHRDQRGPDVYSTFSSDSGTVADYHDRIPKSLSMPETIENYPGPHGESGSSSRRRQVSGRSSRNRRPPAVEFNNDSGVSVLSDSGRSGAASSSAKSRSRVSSWLNGCSESATPSDKEKHRSVRSTSHSISGVSSSLCKANSQCSTSSASNMTVRTLVNTSASNHDMDYVRDGPVGQVMSQMIFEKRKQRSGSGKYTGDGSNVSTMKKPQQRNQKDNSCSSSSSAASPSCHGSSPDCPLTPIIYNFPDDNVPYVVKLQVKSVTLRKFKEHLPKKGNFRYYFETVDSDVGCLVRLEITEDDAELPIYEGKVLSHMRED